MAVHRRQQSFKDLRITEAGSVNKKPRFLIDSKEVINDQSEFKQKELCDGLTFTAGHSCSFSCSFCYVESMLWGNKRLKTIQQERGLKFGDFVVEIADAPTKARAFLTRGGKPRFLAPGDNRVIYASPLVDVAGCMAQVRDTIEICRAILELTHWQIRLLSKSSLLLEVAKALPETYRERMIYGFSTGTIDSELARSFEKGTALVSKRLEALHWLQDHGFRTFGMLCPILPQTDYVAYAQSAASALRLSSTDNRGYRGCESVWGEVLNHRGDSLHATAKALRSAGHTKEAKLLEEVTADETAWEDYARKAFQALAREIPAGKLKFLQYVNAQNLAWWQTQQAQGAILLGRAASKAKATTLSRMVNPENEPLSSEERKALRRCEKVIQAGAIPFVEVGLALKRIKDERLYRETHGSFEAYCIDRFDFQRAHAYRLVDEAEMVVELESVCKNGERNLLPRNEGQARELLCVPAEKRLDLLRSLGGDGTAPKLSARLIREARLSLLGKDAPSTRKKRANERFSVDMASFRAWLAQLIAAIESRRLDDALQMLRHAESTGGVELVEKGRNSGKKRRYPDLHSADDTQLVNGDKPRTCRSVRQQRLLKGLQGESRLEEWANKNGFKLSLENGKRHWILKGKNIIAEWWPSTEKLVLNQRYADGISTREWTQLCAVVEEVKRTGRWRSISFQQGPDPTSEE